MSRRRLGTHGKPLMWTDNKVRMTIRPDPYVLNDQDLAMLLGRHLDIKKDYYDEEDVAEGKAIRAIWKYEQTQKLTQKHTLEVIKDSYYLEQYHQGDEGFEYFDNERLHHKVLLNLVHRIWPQFKNTGEE